MRELGFTPLCCPRKGVRPGGTTLQPREISEGMPADDGRPAFSHQQGALCPLVLVGVWVTSYNTQYMHQVQFWLIKTWHL